jgi:guanyl-specific ribonuclease Sa
MVRLVMLLVLAFVIICVKVGTLTPNGTISAGPTASANADSRIPVKALQVLQYVRENGRAPEGYEGGRVFENREGQLPATGDYREFDVDPHNGPRNADRIIVEWNSKQAWYTGDHYRTFIPMP